MLFFSLSFAFVVPKVFSDEMCAIIIFCHRSSGCKLLFYIKFFFILGLWYKIQWFLKWCFAFQKLVVKNDWSNICLLMLISNPTLIVILYSISFFLFISIFCIYSSHNVFLLISFVIFYPSFK